LGYTFDSFCKASIFVDQSSGFLFVEPQLGFSTFESIEAKQQSALQYGVVVDRYLMDSGTFKAITFVPHIQKSEQCIWYCGTNVHHKNGEAG
jgi:hypothetical protein